MGITPTAIGGSLAVGTLAGVLIEPLGWALLVAGAGFILGGIAGQWYELSRFTRPRIPRQDVEDLRRQGAQR